MPLEISENILDTIHTANYLLLKELKRICDENGIRYYLCAGTLLGAIRHHDLIPWDDDVDVMFDRENYKKILEIAPKALSPEFKLLIPGQIKDDYFFDFIPKIAYLPCKIHAKNTEEDMFGGFLNHICLDLFVLDNVPDSDFMKKVQYGKIMFRYGLALGHRYSLDYSRYKGAEKVFVALLSKAGKRVKLETILKSYDKVSRRYTEKDKGSQMFISNTIISWMKKYFNKDCFEATDIGHIADETYTIPAGYDHFLTVAYKNYMAPPPPEKQKPEHIDGLSAVIDDEYAHLFKK